MSVEHPLVFPPNESRNDELTGNRYACLSDLRHERFLLAFRELEVFSNEYVDFMIAGGLFPEEYAWPRDALHNFTRIWEYPYAYLQLLRHAPSPSEGASPRVLDIGSALTFWPSFLASRGYLVRASDTDAAMRTAFDAAKADARGPAALGRIDYATCDCTSLDTEPDARYDAVTCISVLEHVPESTRAVRALWRVLKPGGVLILTLDVDLHASTGALDPEAFYALRTEWEPYFESVEPETQVHPLDVLKRSNHPRDLTRDTRDVPVQKSHWERLFPLRTLGRRLVRKAKRALHPPPIDAWTVYGATVMRRAAAPGVADTTRVTPPSAPE